MDGIGIGGLMGGAEPIDAWVRIIGLTFRKIPLKGHPRNKAQCQRKSGLSDMSGIFRKNWSFRDKLQQEGETTERAPSTFSVEDAFK
jgi:hypothetical protein